MSLKEFPIIQKLGEGAYSSVYKVKRVSDENEYALKKVKLMNLSDKEKQNALNEVRILASIRQPNIIGYKEAFVDEPSNSLCIVMEYADGGDLYQKILDYQKKGQLFPENEIWSIFIQIVKGLKALHHLQIFHRDLKSANVFLTNDGVVKLGDMNVSKVAKKGLLYTQTGTPYYASPEVWKDQAYDSKSDIWSLGCVLYEMATLKPPFRAEDMEGLYKKVIRGYYPRIPPHFSQELANIIRALLQVSPPLRPSCDKILQTPAIVKRMSDSLLTEVTDEEIQKNSLLNTIKIPKNLHYLTDRLPKPNYEPLKTKLVDKRKFLQTLAGYGDIPNLESQTPEQMKLLVLPKIPVSQTNRKNHHASSQNSYRNDEGQLISVDDKASEFSQPAIPQDPVFEVSQQPQRVHPRSLSRKNIEGIKSKSPNYYSERNEEIQAPKQNPKALQIMQLQENSEQSPIQIGRRIPPPSVLKNSNSINGQKRKDLSPTSRKNRDGARDLLDIEGESKPLMIKGKKAKPNQSIERSQIYEENKLPAIHGSKLPKIAGVGASQNLGLIVTGENPKIKQITKAYNVNLEPINDLKERYRQLKQNDRTKLKSLKNSSLPSQGNEKYQYVYSQENGENFD